MKKSWFFWWFLMIFDGFLMIFHHFVGFSLDFRKFSGCQPKKINVLFLGWCRCYFAKFYQLHRVDTASQTDRKWSKCPEIDLSRRVHIIFAKIYCLTPSELRERVVSSPQQNGKIMLILPKIGPKSLKNVQKNHENHENCSKMFSPLALC